MSRLVSLQLATLFKGTSETVTLEWRQQKRTATSVRAFAVGFHVNNDGIETDAAFTREIYAFELNLYPTANCFKQGHRIQIDIPSSNYLWCNVNHNMDGELYSDYEYTVATNTVYHEREHPTHIELPIRPA